MNVLRRAAGPGRPSAPAPCRGAARASANVSKEASWAGGVLIVCCLVASAAINACVRPLWLSIPLSCLGGPVLFLLAGSTVGGGLGALDGLVLLTGQVAALPVAVLVGAIFRANRGWATH